MNFRMKPANVKRYTRIDAKTDKALVAAADAEGRTVSSMIAKAIRILLFGKAGKFNG